MRKCFCDVCGQEIQVRDFEEMCEKVNFMDHFELCTSCYEKVDFKGYEAAKKTFFLDYCKTHVKKTKKPAKPASTTLEQAVDDEAEKKLAKLDHAHAVCKCKKGGAVVTTCKCGKHEHKVSRKPAKPLPKTMKEIAQETGVEYKRVHKYAYCHGIGTATRTADGHQVRVFTDDEVREIIRHFEGGK